MISKNALDVMNGLLQSPHDQDLIASKISGNFEVMSVGLLPTKDQIRHSFFWIQGGLVLAERLWGIGAIPENIYFTVRPFVADAPGIGFFGYAVELDAIAIGFRAAACCAYVDGPEQLVSHYHLGINGLITARSNLILIILEECFHRLQIKELGRSLPSPDVAFTERDDPLEVEWRQVRDELLNKKVIEIRPASQ